MRLCEHCKKEIEIRDAYVDIRYPELVFCDTKHFDLWNMNNIDKKIETIFKVLEIEGDISFDEKDEEFWKRKLVEVHDKMEKKNG